MTLVTRRCDEIGRRSGLKIHRWQQRAGSSPATGTRTHGQKRMSSAFIADDISFFSLY